MSKTKDNNNACTLHSLHEMNLKKPVLLLEYNCCSGGKYDGNNGGTGGWALIGYMHTTTCVKRVKNLCYAADVVNAE